MNVWLALASRRRLHHAAAAQWMERVGAQQAAFCRITQMGLLRLLTKLGHVDLGTDLPGLPQLLGHRRHDLIELFTPPRAGQRGSAVILIEFGVMHLRRRNLLVLVRRHLDELKDLLPP